MQDSSFRDFVLDQLRDLPDVECRAMFGGYGLFQRGAFFGIIHQGQLYFKTTPATAAAYRALGSRPFQPSEKQTLRTYYEVPAEIVEDPRRLIEWANDALCKAAPSKRDGRRRAAR